MSQQFLGKSIASSIATAMSATVLFQLPGLTPAAIAQTSPTPQSVAGSHPEAAIAQKSATPRANLVAQVYPHRWGDTPAATLYIHSIPVLTFLGSSINTADRSKVPTSTEAGFITPPPQSLALDTPENKQGNKASRDPVERAVAIASHLNYLTQNDFDAASITVGWNSDREAYIISINGAELVTVDEKTILPDTTRDITQDAIQATNRLRRLLGNAAPLQASEIAVRPAPVVQEPQLSVVSRQRGIASWYGPGFHGRRSASGERFNQNAMTAAHRTLPFGTRVRVTNQNNGSSVIVRINDRGPFIRGRIIDLSVGAAKKIGMYGSGLAPVEVEVLGR